MYIWSSEQHINSDSTLNPWACESSMMICIYVICSPTWNDNVIVQYKKLLLTIRWCEVQRSELVKILELRSPNWTARTPSRNLTSNFPINSDPRKNCFKNRCSYRLGLYNLKISTKSETCTSHHHIVNQSYESILSR